ncbi:TonB-dependent receptor [uncultured Paraglaciecola sp.]|uniref:TonB-dependent receptor n=1 Tax=uncultured Paraglaciecola sp. TaxID=1765024 RepID=UPI0030DAFFB9|tara:strand:- start:44603 stop:47413 length:2811 start_codon:yes stop_codon:yes gene_type:complete
MKIRNKFEMLAISLAVSTALGSNFAIAQEAQEAQEQQASDDISNVEVIQVRGIRSSLKESMELKKDSASIQDSIVAEDIGKFPDQNVAESLQRISGVMISRTNGEGTAITVRGLGPKFNAVKLNNRTLATSERGREFDFQVLPSELISGADVIKASRANIAEGGIGSYVTVNTARPLTSPGEHIAGSLNFKYNDLAEKFTPKVSGIYSNTYQDNSVGFLIGFSHIKTENRIDAHETAFWDNVQADDVQRAPGPIVNESGNAVTSGTLWYPGRAQYMSDSEDRSRTSANVTLQYAPTEDLTHTLDVFYTDFDRDAFSNGMQAPLHRDGFEDVVVSENSTILAARKNADPLDGLFQTRAEASKTYAVGYNLFAYSGDWTYEADVSYSKAESEPRLEQYVPNIINASGLIDSDYIAFDSRGVDVINIDSSIKWDDPAGVKAHWNRLSRDELEDKVMEAKFNASYELNSGMMHSVDMGVSYTDRKKSLDQYNSDNSQCGSAAVNTCGALIDMDDSLFSINSDGNFLSDVSGDFPRNFININNLADYTAAMRSITQDNAWGTNELVANASVENTEEILALYTQLNLEGEYDSFSWKGNVGVRYVDSQNKSEGYAIQVLDIRMDEVGRDDGEKIIVTTSDPVYTDAETSSSEFLPSANINLDFANGFYIKGSAAKVMTRAALEDIGVNMSVSGVRLTEYSRNQGNPFLEPYLATQFDLAFEYYQDNGNSYSLNLFTKDFSSWISTQTFVQDSGFDVDRDFDGTDDWDVRETVTQKSNRSGVKLNGVELAALYYFDYLPGWLDGFGVQANYTYTDSSDSDADVFEQEGVVSPGSGVEGFSPNAYNIIAFYDKDGFQARLAYNWRESFLIQRQSEVGGGLPNHADDYGQFDFSTSWDIDDHFTVNAEVINLTDENILEFADVRERVTKVQYSGRRFQIGVSAKF